MTALCLALLAADPQISIHGDFETAVVSDSLRENGGNELHVGSWFLNLKGSFKWEWIKLDVDWAEPVLDFGDEDERNSHNENWLRADGYVSRPWLCPRLQIKLGRDSGVSTSLGVQESGLKSLASCTAYTVLPVTILQTTHFDKGFSLDYETSWISLSAAIIDGDWSIGQADVLAFSDSRANSSPGVLGSLELRVPDSPWYVGATGNMGDIGSYPGQKRRQDNGLLYAGISSALGKAGTLDLRFHGAYCARSPEGDGSGNHVPGVESVGGGFELRLGHILWGGTLREYLAVYTLRNQDDERDGEIWVTGEARRLAGLIGEVSWEYEMLRAFLGCHLMLWDEPVYDEETHLIVVCGIGARF